jgi:hypothetical protein
LTPPIVASGKFFTPVAFDSSGNIWPLLVDDTTGYLLVQVPVSTVTLDISIAILEQQQNTNVGGGTLTLGAWRLRTLNTEVSDVDGLVSLAANVFTLIPGRYKIEWGAPGYLVNTHQTRLYNVTAAAVEAYGETTVASSADAAMSHSRGCAYVNIGVNTQYQIEQQSTATRATDGMGSSENFGNINIYTRVTITKLGDYTV